MIRVKAAAAVAALMVVSSVLAAEIVTQAPGPVLLHNAAGTKIGSYATMEECIKAAEIAPAPGVKSSCRTVTYITKVAECDKVAPPFPVKLSDDGQFVIAPAMQIVVLPGGEWQTQVQAMVPAPWPDCWVIGFVPYTGQDLDGGPPPLAEVPDDFWTPHVGDPFEVVAYNAPPADPQEQPSADPAGTSNTDPPVAGMWMPVQMP